MAYARLTASGLVHTGPCKILSVVLESGADAANGVIKNAVTDTGDALIPVRVTAANTIDRAIYPHGFGLTTGAYFKLLAGTTPVVVVEYIKT